MKHPLRKGRKMNRLIFACLGVGLIASSSGFAKTIDSSQGSADQQSVAGVAGPSAAAHDSSKNVHSKHHHAKPGTTVSANKGTKSSGNYDMQSPDQPATNGNGNSR
jgi:hypothetical protein